MIITVGALSRKSNGGYRRSPIIESIVVYEIHGYGWWDEMPVAIVDPRLMGTAAVWTWELREGPEWY